MKQKLLFPECDRELRQKEDRKEIMKGVRLLVLGGIFGIVCLTTFGVHRQNIRHQMAYRLEQLPIEEVRKMIDQWELAKLGQGPPPSGGIVENHRQRVLAACRRELYFRSPVSKD